MKKLLAAALAASVVAGPAAGAPLDDQRPPAGAKAGGVVGPYFSIPFGGRRSGAPQLGLRLQGVRDYRGASVQSGPVLTGSALDLRLVGDRAATLYVGGTPVTGEEAKKNNLAGGGLVTIGILALAALGAYVVYTAVDGDDETQCLLPEGCP